MNFFENCDNLYYLRVVKDNDNKLIYYCRKCGYEDTNLVQNAENLCISKTHFKKNKNTGYGHIVNEYTKLDPTLPRIKNINCPNSSCSSNKEDENDEKTEKDIIYLKHDEEKMNFVYICSNCDKIWTTK
mgnify:FL=1